MQCEICGKGVEKKRLIELDGGILIVCDECVQFGKEKELPRTSPAAAAPIVPTTRFVGTARKIRQPGFQEKEFDLGLDLVSGYGKEIMKARQKKGLTLQEVARKIFEKESLLHRIESEAIKPSDGLIKKLEKELGIELKAKASD